MLEWVVSFKEVNYQLYLLLEVLIAMGYFIGIPAIGTVVILKIEKILKKWLTK